MALQATALIRCRYVGSNSPTSLSPRQSRIISRRPERAQPLQAAVDVHRREPEGIADLRLRQGKHERALLGEPDRPKPQEQLAQEVRDPGVRLLASDPQQPLPEHRAVDERIAPEGIGDPREAPAKLAHGLVGYEQQLARRDRADAAVHDLEVQALKVGNVAGRVEREDLPLARVRDLVAADEALENEAALGRRVALADDVVVGGDLADAPRQPRERAPLLTGKGEDAVELANKRRFGAVPVHAFRLVD